jgi:hypothetical protein
MANPLELVDGSARAWVGDVKEVLILILIVVVVVVVVVMREVTTMVMIATLIVVTSCPGWMHLGAHPLLHPLPGG